MDYRLQNIDPDLWKRVKSRAAYEGRTVRFVLLQFLQAYAARGFDIMETFDKEEK